MQSGKHLLTFRKNTLLEEKKTKFLAWFTLILRNGGSNLFRQAGKLLPDCTASPLARNYKHLDFIYRISPRNIKFRKRPSNGESLEHISMFLPVSFTAQPVCATTTQYLKVCHPLLVFLDIKNMKR
jgi:hypothetical protein